MKLIFILLLSIFVLSCGNKKNDWDGPNGYGCLDGKFEIREHECTNSNDLVTSRIMIFEPHDDKIYIDYVSATPTSSIAPATMEGSYNRPEEREFELRTGIRTCNIIITGGFSSEDHFDGEWIEQCSQAVEIRCRISGDRRN